MYRSLCLLFCCFLVVTFAIDGDPQVTTATGKHMSTIPDPATSTSEFQPADLNLLETGSEAGSSESVVGPDLERSISMVPVPATTSSTTDSEEYETSSHGQPADLKMKNILETGSEAGSSESVVGPDLEKHDSKSQVVAENPTKEDKHKFRLVRNLSYEHIKEMESLMNDVPDVFVKDVIPDFHEPKLPFALEMLIPTENQDVKLHFKKSTWKLRSWSPVVSTSLKGQKSVWTHSPEDTTAIYCDDEAKSCGVVSVKKINGHPLRFFYIEFMASGKYFTIEPPVELVSANQTGHNGLQVVAEIRSISGVAHFIIEVTSGVFMDAQILSIYLVLTADDSLLKKYVDIQRTIVPEGESVEIAKTKLVYDMMTMGNELSDMIGRLPFKQFQLSVIVSEVKICEYRADCEYLEGSIVNETSVDGNLLINSFLYTSHSPNNTMNIILTTRNILVEGRTLPEGVSSTSTVCYRDSLAIVKFDNPSQRTAQLLANHVANSLGTKECQDENEENAESCPFVALEKTIEELFKLKSTCFQRTVKVGVGLAMPYKGFHPGQVHSVGEQCKLSFGPESTPCWPQESVTLCTILLCRVGNTCKQSPMLKSMVGTSCGPYSWCIENECQKDIRAPSKFEGSPKNSTQPDLVTFLQELNQAIAHLQKMVFGLAVAVVTVVAVVAVVLSFLLLKNKE